MPKVQKILVPVDFSAGSREALAHAFNLARSFGARVTVLHTWEMPAHLEVVELQSEGRWTVEHLEQSTADEVGKLMDKFLGELDQPADVELEPWVTRGDAAETINEAAKDYDLVVMSTHGRSGLSRMVLGSVATKVVRGCPVPVVTVRMSPEALEKDKRKRKSGADDEEEVTYALFESATGMGDAYRELVKAGIAMDDISLVMTEEAYKEAVRVVDRTRAKEGTTAGTLLGAGVGGIAGLLMVLGAGLGASVALLVLGPAVTLAAAGGLVGGLIGWGVERDTAQRIERAIHEGAGLMVVHLRDPATRPMAKRIFSEHGGEQIQKA